MLYDLNIPWSENSASEVQRTISFLDELNYSVLALNYNMSGPIPPQAGNPIPSPLPFKLPQKITVLRRCTFSFADPATNQRLAALATEYDILALRPTTEKAFFAACITISEHSIISLDLTIRYPFHFLPRHLMAAVKRGVKFEICYAQAIQKDGMSRRNFIMNVIAIVRATRGRGLIVSSEAKSVLGVRAPADVGNLMSVWGVEAERVKDAVTVAPRSVVVNEGIKRRGFRGVVDIVEGGEQILPTKDLNGKSRGQPKGQKEATITNRGKDSETVKKGKRKNIDSEELESTPQISKRQAKRMRLEALEAEKDNSLATPTMDKSFAIEVSDREDKVSELSQTRKTEAREEKLQTPRKGQLKPSALKAVNTPDPEVIGAISNG